MNDVKCSFCGADNKTDKEKDFVAGPNVVICSECIETAVDTVESIKKSRMHANGASSIPTPREINEYLSQHVIGQERARRRIAVAVHNHYMRLEHDSTGENGVEIDKSNILLIGPTGTGKTHLARTLARHLDVPFVTADATTLTEAGYVGDDVESILSKLYQAADNDIARAERGIIFIDEIDKIACKGAGTSITRDVSGEGVQQGLLKIIEGTVAHITPNGGRKNPEAPLVKIDTSGILFICGGAFAGLDKIIADRIDNLSMGFLGNVETTASNNPGELFLQTLPEDITSFGLIPEFVGRLPVIATLDDLDEETLVRILTEPKNAVVKQFQAVFGKHDVELTFTEESLKKLAVKAMKRKTGARSLRAMIEDVLTDTMYDLPDVAKTVLGYEIDDQVIENITPPRAIPRPGNDEESLPMTGS